MNGRFYTITNQDQMGHALNYVAEFELPCRVQCKPLKNADWQRKKDKFEAIVNEIAKSQGHKTNSNAREAIKRGAKARWGVVVEEYDPFSGRAIKMLPSSNTYTKEQLMTLCGELDVWCCENGIELSQ